MDNTANGILSRMKIEIPPKYDSSAGSYVHDVLAPSAIEFEAAYSEVESKIKKTLAATATGSDLDAVLEQFGFVRKGATYAKGVVTVTGAADAVIRTGDLVAAGTVVYVVQETAELTGGTADVQIQAERPGTDGNAVAGAVNYFPITLDKIFSVTNAEAVTGGTDSETDSAYKERYYYFLEHPVTSGNKYEYEQWAREVDGVGLAKCYPLRGGEDPNVDTPGTVRVVITTAGMDPAGTDLVAEVAAYIEQRRPIGALIKVESAGVVTINITASVARDPSYSLASITAQYKELLQVYFKSVGFAGGVVPYTQIGAILQGITGVKYYSGLLVNGGTANITVADGQLAVLGGVTLA